MAAFTADQAADVAANQQVISPWGDGIDIDSRLAIVEADVLTEDCRNTVGGEWRITSFHGRQTVRRGSGFCRGALGMFLAVLASSAALPALAQGGLPEPHIGAISVSPFGSGTGLIGEPLADDAVIVNNRIDDSVIGAYLVTVTIAGQPNLDLRGKVNPGFVRKLRLEVIEGSSTPRRLSRTQWRLGAIPPNGTLHIATMIEPHGCRPVTLRASLIGGRHGSLRSTTINLVCQD